MPAFTERPHRCSPHLLRDLGKARTVHGGLAFRVANSPLVNQLLRDNFRARLLAHRQSSASCFGQQDAQQKSPPHSQQWIVSFPLSSHSSHFVKLLNPMPHDVRVMWATI
jgi:hypothetical protein